MDAYLMAGIIFIFIELVTSATITLKTPRFLEVISVSSLQCNTLALKLAAMTAGYCWLQERKN